MAEPRLLTLDCETSPTLAYVWRLFDENIGVDQIVDSTRILCYATKWYGQPRTYFQAEWSAGHRQMLRGLHAQMSQADAIIGYNSDRFDLPKINGEFIKYGFPPIPPVASIDLFKTVKQLGFQSGKLAYVGPHLGIGDKVKHEGFGLWTKVLAGDPAARRRMRSYNIQDTRLTEQLYTKIRPFIKNHPWCGTVGKTSCPSCGSHKVQRRGERRTKSFFIERLHCQSCGTWSDGARTKASKGRPG